MRLCHRMVEFRARISAVTHEKFDRAAHKMAVERLLDVTEAEFLEHLLDMYTGVRGLVRLSSVFTIYGEKVLRIVGAITRGQRTRWEEA